MSTTMKVLVLKIIFKADETEYFVADTTGGIIVGNSAFIAEDVVLTVKGEWVTHPRYGRQFKVSHILVEDNQHAIMLLLKGGFLKHVREAKADVMLEALGNDLFAVLDDCLAGDTIALARFYAIKGIGEIIGPEILESWKVNRERASDMLAGVRVGLSLWQTQKAVEIFGSGKLTSVVLTNPYRLIEIPRISWETVDTIAGEFSNIAEDSPARMTAACIETLRQQARFGHTCATTQIVSEGSAVLTGYPDALAIARANFEGLHELEDTRLMRLESYEQSHEIAVNLLRIKRVTSYNFDVPDSAIDRLSPFPLDIRQREAVHTALSSPITLLTGGAGTGKTTVIRTIVAALEEQGAYSTLACLAGKAAVRVEEATGYKAATIHRTLGIFNPFADHMVDTELFVVDEASMLDESLMWWITRAVRDKHKLLLVGDNQQLPPIGAGEPFSNLITSKIFDHVNLDTIHRQGRNSGIVHEAARIAHGELPTNGDNDMWDDFKLVTVGDNISTADKAIEHVGLVMHKYNFSIYDLMILSPVRNGPFGVHEINRRLQAIHNPGVAPLRGLPFKLGDKVMHTSHNDYDREVFNGECGIVTWIADNDLEREMLTGLRGTGEQPVVLHVKMDVPERIVRYSRPELDDLVLAYATTVHKGQGSEWPGIIVVVPLVGDFVDTRMLYTMITRSRSYCLMFAANGAIQSAISNRTQRVRNTALLQVLEEI